MGWKNKISTTKVRLFTASINKAMVQQIDALVKEGFFVNRMEYIRTAIVYHLTNPTIRSSPYDLRKKQIVSVSVPEQLYHWRHAQLEEGVNFSALLRDIIYTFYCALGLEIDREPVIIPLPDPEPAEPKVKIKEEAGQILEWRDGEWSCMAVLKHR